VERVVAVVGERPILLTELRHRALPNLLRIAATAKDPSFVAAAESETYREVLGRMIDDRLEEQAADKARITVAPEEVDKGVQNVATNNKITVRELLLEVRHQGLTEQDFRDEIRRQILEGKLIELRVRPRVRVTEQDARATYQRWREEVAKQHLVDLRVIALKMAAPNDQGRITLAAELAKRARGGEDFCALAAQYTDDVATRPTCGSRGPQPMDQLIPPIQQAVLQMRPGEISDPVLIHLADSDAVVILQVLNEPKVPAFDDVRNDMMNRALLEGLERQRKLWLQELRRGVYIDVRL
jgi:peptidyl-prolyl cis-trans isomerase SurA